MKVLVTGANGFLGSWLTRKLCELGHDVHILNRSSSDLSEIDDLNVKKIIGDVTDLSRVEDACKGIEVVFHLAGVVAYTRQQRGLMEEVNVGGTRNIISGVKKNHVRRLVHVSSVTAIGASFTPHAMNEDSEYNLKHLDLGYFETKRTSEELVRTACLNSEIDAVIVNPSTIYGPGDAKKGSRNTMVKVAQGKMPFYTSGGVNVVPVESVVDGILKALEKGACGERYILCGENMTIKELFSRIALTAGAPPPRIGLPKPLTLGIGRAGDLLESIGKKGPLNTENAWAAVLYHWFDSTKAQNELGFSPGSASEAIQKSVDWMKVHKLI